MSKKETLLSNMEMSFPLSQKDVRKVYLEAEIDALEQVQKLIKGYPVNGLVKGIVTEEQITQLLQEKKGER